MTRRPHWLATLLATGLLTIPDTGFAHSEQACGTLRGQAAPLRARIGNLVRENALADRQQLSRLPDSDLLRKFTRAGLLVPLPAATKTYHIAGVSTPLRVARPWTKRFIEELSHAFRRRYGARLKITSLTRTMATQHRLRAINLNAAPARGPRRSTHLTGAAVDISKRSLAGHEVRWLRSVLGRLAGARLLAAIEEFVQPHFHVLVFRRYEGGLESPCESPRQGANSRHGPKRP